MDLGQPSLLSRADSVHTKTASAAHGDGRYGWTYEGRSTVSAFHGMSSVLYWDPVGPVDLIGTAVGRRLSFCPLSFVASRQGSLDERRVQLCVCACRSKTCRADTEAYSWARHSPFNSDSTVALHVHLPACPRPPIHPGHSGSVICGATQGGG